MRHLIKIRDVSNKYDISTRTLRYYEQIGLITSHRSADYAYRLYDEKTLQRLEQILILRKLNISIKDIQRIFSMEGTDSVLYVLQHKVEEIDGDVALLKELKEILLDFIVQIRNADFTNDTDVKKLYERAQNVEVRLSKVSYDGTRCRQPPPGSYGQAEEA